MLLSLHHSSSRAVLPAWAMSGLMGTLKMALKETNQVSSKANTKRYPRCFPHLPQVLNTCAFSPRQREGKMVWLLKYQKCLRSPSDGYGHAAGPELAPTCTCSPLLMLKVPTRHPPVLSAVGGASMSPAPTDPSFLQSPSSLGWFLEQDLSWSPGQRQSQPPREGAFGIFIPAGLVFFFP